MKRITTTISAAAVALFALAGCSAQTSDSAASTSQLKVVQQGTLTVCTTMGYEPMSWYENGTGGKELGFDMDSVRAVSKELGLNVKVVNSAFEGLMPALDAGRCDVVWSALYLNDDRQKVADAIAYLDTSPAVLVPKGNPKGLTKEEDLAGNRVGILAGSAFDSMLGKLNERLKTEGKPAITVSTYSNAGQIGSVTAGKEDAAVDTDVYLGQVAKKNTDFDLVRGAFDSKSTFAAYVKKGSDLAPAIAEAWKKVVDSGDAKNFAAEYGIDSANIVATGKTGSAG